jgi:deoxyribodipyrimidine photolyase-related protein
VSVHRGLRGPCQLSVAPACADGIETGMGFTDQLRACRAPRERKAARAVYVAYDQLSRDLGALAHADPRETCVVLVENAAKARRRPVHQQKLALVLANQRHFALELARAGFDVRYVVGDAPYRDILRPVAAELGSLTMMRAAERELRHDLAPLIDEGAIVEVAHDGWLTTTKDFVKHAGAHAPWRMDRFYKGVRQQTGILMEAGEPEGGRFSFDDENREVWRGEPRAPAHPTFPVDDIKREVAALIAERFARHPGQVTLDALPATVDDARALWDFAMREALPHFGPYEDAMSTRSSTIFHTRISPLVNLHRILPRDVVMQVAHADIPLQSREGFVRQVLGWREFVHHVHEATDGFRTLDDVTVARAPGDGGYARWSGRTWPPGVDDSRGETVDAAVDGGAVPHAVVDTMPLPPAFWGRASGLSCLDHVVSDVWRDGWSHHITRLMVLANIATLLDVNARELTDWFWVAYTDAYDWVVEPNVLAMGTFSVGEVMTTKPYVSGAGYIERMSDSCGTCAFSPKKDCPLTSLYWAYLARHEGRLRANPRMKLPIASLRKRDDERRAADVEAFAHVRETLQRGDALVSLGSSRRRRAKEE